MDKMDQLLIDAALQAARKHGLEAALVKRGRKDARAAGRVDMLVSIGHGKQMTTYAVEARRVLTPATLGVALHQLAQLPAPALLITDYVTPPLADRLHEAGVDFLDTAGNAYLNRPPLLVWVKGQRPAAKPVAPHAGRAFRATGLQVVFALLCQPELAGRPYREIAHCAGVAHGTVGIVIANLAEEGFIVDIGQGGRRLRNMHRLLDTWAEAYARMLRPKLLLGRYRAPTGDWWQQVAPLAYQAQFGAEPAAARLDDYLRPGVVTLYAEKVPARLLADQRLRTDPAGDVEIRKRFWAFEQLDHPELVPPVLIYADLLATGDARCMEAAKRIYEHYLAGLFEQA